MLLMLQPMFAMLALDLLEPFGHYTTLNLQCRDILCPSSYEQNRALIFKGSASSFHKWYWLEAASMDLRTVALTLQDTQISITPRQVSKVCSGSFLLRLTSKVNTTPSSQHPMTYPRLPWEKPKTAQPMALPNVRP